MLRQGKDPDVPEKPLNIKDPSLILTDEDIQWLKDHQDFTDEGIWKSKE